MHTTSPLRHGVHVLHEGGLKVFHATGQLMHDKRYWGVLALIALAVALITLAVNYGSPLPPIEYGMPVPYSIG
mgnify:CR=1 FL=1